VMRAAIYFFLLQRRRDISAKTAIPAIRRGPNTDQEDTVSALPMV